MITLKNKVLTAVSVIMLFVPWTILILRRFDWALEFPVAERIVAAQAQDPALPDPFLQHIRAVLQQFHRKIVLMAALRAELMDHILYGFPKIGPELL